MDFNHKKTIAILASMGGFILTIAGVITLFFPNFFNLEVNKIKTFEIEIENESDALSFEKFIEENKEKLVYLNLKICEKLLITSHALDKYKSKCPTLDIGSDAMNNILTVNGYEETESGTTTCVFGEGTTFKFDKETWSWDKNAICKNDTTGMNIMSGYFLIPENSGWGQGWTEWFLTSIDKKDIKLKDY